MLNFRIFNVIDFFNKKNMNLMATFRILQVTIKKEKNHKNIHKLECIYKIICV